MKIHFIRNATMIIESGAHFILVDPMLSDKGALPPLSIWRHKAKRNPLVPLPPGTNALLARTTCALITHCQRGHKDHLDKAGMVLLQQKRLPTYCRTGDAHHLRRLDVKALKTGRRQAFLDGFITPVPARHGHGFIAKIMGQGVGYLIELSGEPTLYIAGDTVLTDEVRTVLQERRPDVAIVAAGHASVDIGQAILMSLDEVMEFSRLAPGRVVANHLQALNHCPTLRSDVIAAAKAAGLASKVAVPSDGDCLSFSLDRP